jgi:hypothetical protein
VLPKDSAHLWSVDNEQRKALFTQPDNSITTNRYLAQRRVHQSIVPPFSRW